MGMFDFMKSVGKKLGFGEDDDDAAKAEVLKKELESHKLGTDKVDVAVKGDTVVLKGVVKDQSAFEKAVIAVGNTLGVSRSRQTNSRSCRRTPASSSRQRRHDGVDQGLDAGEATGVLHGQEGRQPLEDRRAPLWQGQRLRRTP